MMTSPDAVSVVDITIVGAGIVGASLACLLAQHPAAAALRIAVVEAGGEPHSYCGENFDPRVVALTQTSRELLEEIQCWQPLLERRLCPFRDVHVWDGEGTGNIGFSSAEVHADALGYIVENSLLVRVLRGRLRALGGVEIIQPASVVEVGKNQEAGECVDILLRDGRKVRTTLLIAADGAQSAVRELAQFPTREWDYHQQAIVTTVRTQASHNYTAAQRFSARGPLAFLPLQECGDSHYSSIVWSADTELAQELMALSDQAFCQTLTRTFEQRLGAVEQTDQRYCIPLRQRHARYYVQPGIALVGDAAHNIHPLAGQGVNLGLQDVAVLSEEIFRALGRHVPLHHLSILRRYQRQRMAGNLAMMSAMEGFKRLFGSRSLAVTYLRNTGMAELNSLPLLKNFIVKTMVG